MKENKIGVGQNNPMFGKKASLDTRIKMSLKHSKKIIGTGKEESVLNKKLKEED